MKAIDFDDFKKMFGKKIQKIRESKNLSLREVASNCNLDDSNISKMEHGKANVTLATIFDLSAGLEVNPKELFDFDLEV